MGKIGQAFRFLIPVIALATLVVFMTGAGRRRREKVARQKVLDARKSLEESLNQVVGATGKLLEPLEGLSDEQRDAVVMLGLLTQGIMLAKRPAANMQEDILVAFKDEVDSICPPLGTLAISRDPCFEATVAYLLALKDREEKGLTEAECPKSGGPGAVAV